MIAGANPRRARRRKKRNAFVPNRYVRKRHYKRHNPMKGPLDIMGAIPSIVTIGTSIVATRLSPVLFSRFIGTGTWQKYASEGGMAIGGGFVLGMVKTTRKYAPLWMAAGLGVIVADLIMDYVVPMLGVSMPAGVSDFGVPLAYQSFGAEPEGPMGPEGSFEMGAFPTGDRFSDFGAFVSPGMLTY